MLVIRLRRIGKKNKPTYRIVVTEHTFPVNGKFTADLGFYNPHTKEAKFDTKVVLEWLGKGAQPSNTIAKLLEKAKVKHSSVVIKKFKKASKSEEASKMQKPQPDAAPSEEATAEESPEAAQVTEEQPAEPVVAEASEPVTQAE